MLFLWRKIVRNLQNILNLESSKTKHFCMLLLILGLLFLMWPNNLLKYNQLRHFSEQKQSRKTCYNATDINLSRKHGMNLMTFSGYGRLGNQMFRYASVYALAKSSGHVLLLPRSHEDLLSNFNLDITCVHPNDINVTGWHRAHVMDYNEAIYDSLRHLPRHKHVYISGYFFSWKFFIMYENDIRRQFQFKKIVQSAALDMLQRITQSKCSKLNGLFGSPCHLSSPTYVGVHLRRPDKRRYIASNSTHLSAVTLAYVIRAMAHVCTRHKNIVFVICGNDIVWNINNVYLPPACSDQNIVHCVPTVNPTIHMALLASCNHSIITNGTFGWWSAFLSGGYVVYDKSLPWLGSSADLRSVHKDFFLPHWIGL